MCNVLVSTTRLPNEPSTNLPFGGSVIRVVCAVDCGWIINPDTIRAQMEGGIIYGLTAALYGEITIRNGQVVQKNFNDYPMVRMSETPEIQVYIVPSTEAPGGIGEASTPVIAPAVANAIFAATGKRVRHLPIRAADLRNEDSSTNTVMKRMFFCPDSLV
jgi:isoquinoline 1-oxidoreductase beta subunit